MVEKIVIIINKLKFKQYEIIIRGAIFCQVIKIKFLCQFNPSITLGNQKWKGAAPLLISIEEEIKINR